MGSVDLDLYLYRYELVAGIYRPVDYEKPVANSVGGMARPYEFLKIKNDCVDCCLAVKWNGGTIPNWMQLRIYSDKDGFSLRNLHNASSSDFGKHSIGNPAESFNPGMLAVGATHDNNNLAGYSSRGPIPGGCKSDPSIVIVKPDIVGLSNQNSWTMMRSTTATSTPSTTFSGTSASAPHVAGLAALAMEAYPSAEDIPGDYEHLEYPVAIAQYLRDSAIPVGSKKNHDWGYGRAALPTMTPTPTSTPLPTATPFGRILATATPTPDGWTPASTPEPLCVMELPEEPFDDDRFTSSFVGSFDRCIETYYTFTNMRDRVGDLISFPVQIRVVSLVPLDLLTIDNHDIPHSDFMRGIAQRGGTQRFPCRSEDLARLWGRFRGGDFNPATSGTGYCQLAEITISFTQGSISTNNVPTMSVRIAIQPEVYEQFKDGLLAFEVMHNLPPEPE